jgi:hypothetical protein
MYGHWLIATMVAAMDIVDAEAHLRVKPMMILKASIDVRFSTCTTSLDMHTGSLLQIQARVAQTAEQVTAQTLIHRVLVTQRVALQAQIQLQAGVAELDVVVIFA